MKKINLHIYPSPYKFESRINKEVKSILKMGLASEVLILATWDNGLLEYEKQNDNITIIRIKTAFHRYRTRFIFKILSTLIFNFKVYLFIKKERLSYINCHSLLVLPICVILKYITGAKLIYDPHELETERIGLNTLSRNILKLIESMLIKFVDFTIVVSEPIKEWYVNQYFLNNIIVVRNMPYNIHLSNKKSLLLKQKFKIPHDHILFIYQGLLSSGRGIDLLLRVFSNCNLNKHIVFMGYGDQESKIQNYVSNYENIHFQTAVNNEDIIKYTSSADIGIHILEDYKGLSYKYSLPNKFGEYLISGIPIMVSKHYEYMSKLINENSIGWSIDSTYENMILIINDISFKDLTSLKNSIKLYSSQIGWEVDEQLYFGVYK